MDDVDADTIILQYDNHRLFVQNAVCDTTMRVCKNGRPSVLLSHEHVRAARMIDNPGWSIVH